MVSKNLCWGILGCGDVTEVKSGPAYQRVDGISLGAVMRRDADKAADYARRHGVPKSYADADALIGDPAIDAVYIATPPASHCELALRVAAAGKPCCVEKPMANSVAECDAMNAAFAKAGVPLIVAYYRRSLPRFQRVAEWLNAGRIGEVRHLRWDFCRPATDADLRGELGWRTDPAVSPGGYFDDLASHGLDLFDFLLGPLVDVAGRASNQQGLYATPDAVIASWRHESGATGSGHWHFGADRGEDRVTVIGSRGRIHFSVFAPADIALLTATDSEQLVLEDPATVQLPHVENIRRALAGEGEHPSTGESATRTARVMAAILAS
ncbi:MAG: Gfo/Idh/MocA family oxidoreductase [Pseudomonadota bacterium]